MPIKGINHMIHLVMVGFAIAIFFLGRSVRNDLKKGRSTVYSYRGTDTASRKKEPIGFWFNVWTKLIVALALIVTVTLNLYVEMFES
ncbi:MAG: hypothetical protein Pars2KO_30730 [Parasphingorhabdus sp.]